MGKNISGEKQTKVEREKENNLVDVFKANSKDQEKQKLRRKGRKNRKQRKNRKNKNASLEVKGKVIEDEERKQVVISIIRRCKILNGLKIMWLAPFCHINPFQRKNI